MRITGRGKLRGELTRDKSGNPLVRLDDDRNPEFWAEVRITAEDIRCVNEQ